MCDTFKEAETAKAKQAIKDTYNINSICYQHVAIDNWAIEVNPLQTIGFSVRIIESDSGSGFQKIETNFAFDRLNLMTPVKNGRSDPLLSPSKKEYRRAASDEHMLTHVSTNLESDLCTTFRVLADRLQLVSPSRLHLQSALYCYKMRRELMGAVVRTWGL